MSTREQQLAQQRVAVSRNDHILAFGEVFETLLTFWDSMNSFSVCFAILCHTYCCTWPTITKVFAMPTNSNAHVSPEGHEMRVRHTLQICTPSKITIALYAVHVYVAKMNMYYALTTSVAGLFSMFTKGCRMQTLCWQRKTAAVCTMMPPSVWCFGCCVGPTTNWARGPPCSLATNSLAIHLS